MSGEGEGLGPVSRVGVIGWPVSEARSEYAAAATLLGRVLAERGIAVAEPGESADGFIALPGGTETLADLFSQCLDEGGRDRPCGLLDIAGYFSDLLKTTEDHVIDRFAREAQRGRLIVDRDPAGLVRALVEYRPPETRRPA